MRILLGLLLVLVTASDVFSLDLSLGPGLSAKNAMLNVVAALLIVRFVMQRNFKAEIPAVLACFGLMFLYALISIPVAAWAIEYPHYSLITSILTLKINIADAAMFFLTFFYGARTEADARFLLRVLFAAFSVSSLLTITNVYGLTDVGSMRFGDNNLYEANRVYGFFGHANETGVLIAIFLPAYAALVTYDRGISRLLWAAGMALSAVVLIMTGSRGALAGLFVGGAIGAILCRGYLPIGRLLRGAVPFLLTGLPVILIIGAKYGGEFVQRLASQGSAVDAGEISSGRTDLWTGAIGRMMDTPLSLITGFGWNVYDSMGFILIPHNHYIAIWFELGLVGLTCYLLIISRLAAKILRALPTVNQDTRYDLIAAVYAIAVLSVSIFFEQLFKPWLYIWPYLGLCLRLAVTAEHGNADRPVFEVAEEPATPLGAKRLPGSKLRRRNL